MRLPRYIAVLFLAICMLCTTPLFAQTKKKKKTKVVYEKETVIRFDDNLIKGRVIKPDGFFLLRKRPKQWQDLIKVRDSYKQELLDMKLDL